MPDIDVSQAAPDTTTHSTTASTKTRAPVVLTLLVFAVVAFAFVFSSRESRLPYRSQERENSQRASLLDDRNAATSTRPPEMPQEAQSRAVPDGSTNSSDPQSRISFDGHPFDIFRGILMLAVIILAGYELVIACRNRLGRWVALLMVGMVFQLSPMLAMRTFGMIFVGAASLIILHRLHHRGFRNFSFLVGFAIGLSAFWCAFNGTLLRLERTGINGQGIEATSVAVYEATQVLMMNMAPHDGKDEETGHSESSSDSDTRSDSAADAQSRREDLKKGASFNERAWFNGARILATLFALFLAYQALTHFSRSTRYRAHMLLLRCKPTRPDACLVCGIGQVGFRLVQELRAEHLPVIVLEKSNDHANLKATIETGAIVLTADATRAEVIDDLPLNAISHVYVTCGDDAVNLEIAMNVKRAIQTDEKTHARLRSTIKCLRGFLEAPARKSESDERLETKPKPGNALQRKTHSGNPDGCQCYVQVIDPEIQGILHHKFHEEGRAGQTVSVYPFNADLNAVRNLIQDELTVLRPRHGDEVGLYVVVGLDNRWEEVVLGLANLAHFENRKRSRILVITANPEDDAKSFLLRYPRLTIDKAVQLDWSSVRFNPLADDWSCTFPAAVRSRAEVLHVPGKTTRGEPHESLLQPFERNSQHPFARLFVRCRTGFLTPEMDGCQCIPQYRDALNLRAASPESVTALVNAMGGSVADGGEVWLEVEGIRNCVVQWATEQNIDMNSAFELRQWGVEFATQTLFTKLPVVPGDDAFLSFLHRLIDEQQWLQKNGSSCTPRSADAAASYALQRRIRPVMIIAGRDDSRNFTWASTFARRWERFRGRHCVKPPAVIGNNASIQISEIMDMSVFVWISEQESFRDLLKRSPTSRKESDVAQAKSDNAQQHVVQHHTNGQAVTTETIRAIIASNNGVIAEGCRSFGDPIQAAGRNAVHEKARRYLSVAAESAYDFVLKESKKESANSPESAGLSQSTASGRTSQESPDKARVKLDFDPEEYDHHQSNNHAADHAIIKLAMILNDLTTWQAMTSACRSMKPQENLTETFTGRFLDPRAEIELISVQNTSQKITHDSDRLLAIAEVEHNRWCAELLLRNAIWHPVELKLEIEGKAKSARPPEAIHVRKTLCPWQQVKTDPVELQKDIDQVWFILHAFAARGKDT